MPRSLPTTRSARRAESASSNDIVSSTAERESNAIRRMRNVSPFTVSCTALMSSAVISAPMSATA